MTHIEALKGKKLPECSIEEIDMLLQANVPLIIGSNKFISTDDQVKQDIIKALQRDFKDKTIESLSLAFKMARNNLISLPEYPNFNSRMLNSIFISYFSYLHRSNIRVSEEEDMKKIKDKNQKAWEFWQKVFNECEDVSTLELFEARMIYDSLYQLGHLRPEKREILLAKEKAKAEYIKLEERKNMLNTNVVSRREVNTYLNKIKNGEENAQIKNMAKKIILEKHKINLDKSK